MTLCGALLRSIDPGAAMAVVSSSAKAGHRNGEALRASRADVIARRDRDAVIAGGSRIVIDEMRSPIHGTHVTQRLSRTQRGKMDCFFSVRKDCFSGLKGLIFWFQSVVFLV